MGIINFISYSITIVAPMFAELSKRESIIILMCFCLVSLAASIFLPSKEDQENFQEDKAEREEIIRSASRSSVLNSSMSSPRKIDDTERNNLNLNMITITQEMSPRDDLIDIDNHLKP